MSNTDAQGIKVSVELGEAYEPSARLAAAIAELADAIREAHGDDVEGFGLGELNVGITSLHATWSPTTPLTFSAWTNIPAPTPSPAPRSWRGN